MFEYGGTLRAAHVPRSIGLVAQAMLLAALAGPPASAPPAGSPEPRAHCRDRALARRLAPPPRRTARPGRLGDPRPGDPRRRRRRADRGLVRPDAPLPTLVTLAAVALALDCGGRAVRPAHATASTLGAQLDGEVDAFLILAPLRVRRPVGRRVGA